MSKKTSSSSNALFPQENQITYETGTHWVLEKKPGCFEVYQSGLTHSTLCARIGPYPELGRAKARAIEECNRRSGIEPAGEPVSRALSDLFPLPAPSRERLDQEHALLQALYGKKTPDLASRVLLLAYEARAYCRFEPDSPVYDADLLWHGIPELADRLGVHVVTSMEQSDEWSKLTNAEFRTRLGACLLNTSREPTVFPEGASRNPLCWSLLVHTPCNGNPVAIAMDRLCPPDLDNRDDPLVRHMLEIGARRGQSGAMWSPDWMADPSDALVEDAASDVAPNTARLVQSRPIDSPSLRA